MRQPGRQLPANQGNHKVYHDKGLKTYPLVSSIYKFLVNSVPSGVISVDRDLRITGFNPWAERLTGYSAKEAVGTFRGEILQGGMCDTKCPLRIAVTNGEPMSLLESTVQTKTGETVPVRMNVAALFEENGELIGGVESFQDISALKTLERERNNLISTFAHDMKSSLTIIGGFVLRLSIVRRSKGASRLSETSQGSWRCSSRIFWNSPVSKQEG